MALSTFLWLWEGKSWHFRNTDCVGKHLMCAVYRVSHHSHLVGEQAVAVSGWCKAPIQGWLESQEAGQVELAELCFLTELAS